MEKLGFWREALVRQYKWIADHGGCLAGYVERYGDPGIPRGNGLPMYGNGGTAIYAADKAELKRLELIAVKRY